MTLVELPFVLPALGTGLSRLGNQYLKDTAPHTSNGNRSQPMAKNRIMNGLLARDEVLSRFDSISLAATTTVMTWMRNQCFVNTL